VDRHVNQSIKSQSEREAQRTEARKDQNVKKIVTLSVNRKIFITFAWVNISAGDTCGEAGPQDNAISQSVPMRKSLSDA
jgi:hypothetical protein